MGTDNDRIRIQLIEGMSHKDAYPFATDDDPIEFHETHISLVFLVGDFAYKVKKALKTDFLDYSTLDRRKAYCEEEVRLDGRYAPELYLGVVPICLIDQKIRVEGDGEPIEYAVRMRRFPKGALLSERLKAGEVTGSEIQQLAESVARFHQEATVCEPSVALQWPHFLEVNTREIVQTLSSNLNGNAAAMLSSLQHWAMEFLAQHQEMFYRRVEQGFIRECHGDLHLQNVVQWKGRWVPFDGIEFNDRLRWIDVMCDVAFLTMDLDSQGRLDLSRSFFNAYLEHTGDYGSLVLFHWFLFYRALVRAMVASIRAKQSAVTNSGYTAAISDCQEHLELAHRYTRTDSTCLWITHGLSGSGKTTASEWVVQRFGAIRLRSDIERKRCLGMKPTDRPSSDRKELLYSDEGKKSTYARLRNLASDILESDLSVVVDATFLKRSERKQFHEIAVRAGVPFHIIDCKTDASLLHRRISERVQHNQDASDADIAVLQLQIATAEPLDNEELQFRYDVPTAKP